MTGDGVARVWLAALLVLMLAYVCTVLWALLRDLHRDGTARLRRAERARVRRELDAAARQHLARRTHWCPLCEQEGR